MLKEVLVLHDNKLKKYIKKTLKKGEYDAIIEGKDFMFFPQKNARLLLVSHLDTIHQDKINNSDDIYYNNKKRTITATQGIGGDDRCGVYALLKVALENNNKPSILFCDKEEIGGLGASEFIDYLEDNNNCELVNNFTGNLCKIIECDKAGFKTITRYDDENDELINEFIKLGFKDVGGSFSDISIIAPALKISAVNIGVGYYNPHTQHEIINVDELLETINILIKYVDNQNNIKKIHYIEDINNYNYISRNVRVFNNRNYDDYSYYNNYYGETINDDNNYLIEDELLMILNNIYVNEIQYCYEVVRLDDNSILFKNDNGDNFKITIEYMGNDKGEYEC